MDDISELKQQDEQCKASNNQTYCAEKAHVQPLCDRHRDGPQDAEDGENDENHKKHVAHKASRLPLVFVRAHGPTCSTPGP